MKKCVDIFCVVEHPQIFEMGYCMVKYYGICYGPLEKYCMSTTKAVQNKSTQGLCTSLLLMTMQMTIPNESRIATIKQKNPLTTN